MSDESANNKINESSNPKHKHTKFWDWIKNRFLDPDSPKLEWEEYKQHLELYRFYLDITLKANVFFYAIAGVVLTVVFDPDKQNLNPSIKEFFLVTLFIMSIALGGVLLCGAVLWFILAFRINRAVKKAPREIAVKVPPFIQLLTGVLLLLGGIFIVVAAYLYKIMKSNGII
jgi:hypothetical protein